jgi:four helix bundle protein
MGEKIRTHRDLVVFKRAFESAMAIFECSKAFPKEERYSLTDQIRKCSRSVCANLVEAWRKRRYLGAFVSKLSDAEAEAAETQFWLECACKCGYLKREQAVELYKAYDAILATIVGMIKHPETWIINDPP